MELSLLPAFSRAVLNKPPDTFWAVGPNFIVDVYCQPMIRSRGAMVAPLKGWSGPELH